MNIRSAAIVVSGIVVAIIIVNGYLSVMKTSNVQLVDYRADITGGFVNQQNVISSRAVNSGEGESNLIIVSYYN